MMKYVFAFVFLCHLCQGDNVRNELIRELKKLRKHDFNFENNTISVPSMEMNEHACECQGTFAKELKHLLNHVEATTPTGKAVLQKLKSNADHLKTDQNANISCPMETKSLPSQKAKPVCEECIDFLKILNEKDC